MPPKNPAMTAAWGITRPLTASSALPPGLMGQRSYSGASGAGRFGMRRCTMRDKSAQRKPNVSIPSHRCPNDRNGSKAVIRKRCSFVDRHNLGAIRLGAPQGDISLQSVAQYEQCVH